MARKSIIDQMVFRKCPDASDQNLRDRIYAFAKDGEKVGDLIERAHRNALGSKRQIRQAIYLGAKGKGAKFRLENPT
jgi:hypothetical protein